MTPNAGAFLRAILPEQGFYVAWVKKHPKGSWNNVCLSLDELANYVLAQNDKGHDAYHACATFQYREGVWNARKEKMEIRSQANAWGAKSLWLDVDAGETKAYATSYDAAARVAEFAEAAQLPPPLYVGSGYGIHVYWPLECSLNPVEWLQLASGLKASAAQHGLACDPARTTDIASVLRTPGTHNRKHGAAMHVACGPLVGPYPLDAFTALLDVQVPVQAVRTATLEPTALTAAITAAAYDQLYADIIADNCAQIGKFRSTAGNIPEPLWYAGLGVVAWCEDGPAKGHEYSSGHPRYTEAETDAKMQRALQLTGATTCQKFQSLDPATCALCPHRGKITSPTALGKRGVSPQCQSTAFSPTTPRSWSKPAADTSNSPLTGALQKALFDEPLPPLRLPWKWNKFRQLVMATESNGQESDILICSYPMYLEGVQIGEGADNSFSYHFKQFLPHEGWLSVVLSAEHLMGPGGLAKLFGKGVVVHDPRAFNAYVRDAVDFFNASQRLRMRYDQFGWKDKDSMFLLGNRLYTAAGVEDAIGSEEIKDRSKWLTPRQGGSLVGWSAAANALFQGGCEVQAFALLCSFAAPLMRFHTTAEGGAIVALHSRGSAKGKSTALAAIASVWGDKKGIEITNIDTSVSKGITLGVLGNLPIIYDELQQQDADNVRDFVRVFTNGRDRMRGTTAGTIRHVSASWQTLLISASNASLTDTLYHASGIDALAFRVLELPTELPPTVDTSKGDVLKRQLEQNAGHAGDAYLRYLLQPDALAWTRQALEHWTAQLWAQTGLATQHRFRVRCLGAVAVAAALVNRIGLLDFNPDRIVQWATERVVAAKDDAPVTGRDASEASISELSAYLAAHVADTLVMPRAYKPGDRGMLPLVTPARRLMIRFEKDNGRLLLAEAPLRLWLLKREVSYRGFMADLHTSMVVLAPRRMNTLSAGTDLPGGQQPCVEVNAHHPAMSGVLTTVTVLEEHRRSVAADIQTKLKQ